MHPEYRKGLLRRQAKLAQRIAEAEALAVMQSKDDTLQRVTTTLAELREAREDVEGKLRASR